MNTSALSLEFELSLSEIQKLNKMYFKHLFKERMLVMFCIVLFLLIFVNLENDNDLIEWIIRSLALIIFFLMIQHSIVNSICKIIFRATDKLLKSRNLIHKYRFNFTSSFIYVHSPLGSFKHKWNKIEKAILTKDFFFLYVKERNGYIISISNKDAEARNMKELITFIEKNVTHVTKV
ncbi:YcxB family protein [uncultured Flavobacterium sp.]|uniref:YcxB family protein n=1 Tax=uncultured Flavobacterium sp. TaxID=165435 RepID=UPI00292D408B|nr:YcxB family protein [uncultured Flavobacterium sp.]